MKLSATMEDYLEAIYLLNQANGCVRIGEIAQKLQVKSPSVNSAVTFLTDQGLVAHEKYGGVCLTKEGEKAAYIVTRKHEILFRFLSEILLLDPVIAEQEACCIEHAISAETSRRLAKFFQFFERRMGADKPEMFEDFETYFKQDKSPDVSMEDHGKNFLYKS